ncbi:unnamed protein product [Adineta ricciae]|uniref:t-SNARE coiled-coil homology domain-containing protein n=1 Tax=Adineta ricciae TaxID=249248 RepID=A0A813W8P4_ADIRI|nr:unnamed protein product [Adineta ricciae]
MLFLHFVHLLVSSASDFQRINNAITTNISKIKNNISELESLIQKIGTSDDSEPLRDRYLHLQNEMKTLVQQTNRAFEQLQSTPVRNEDDRRHKENLTKTLSQQYMKLINRFQELQRLGAQKEKASLERARSASFRKHSMHDSNGVDNVAFTNTPYQQQVVIPMEQEADARAIQERDSQLRQLETNIIEVNELFKDVAKLVHEHGEIIDNIENNVVETEAHVDTGNRQLKQAVTYQSAARRKKIILIGILITIIVIIALILGIYFGVAKK